MPYLSSKQSSLGICRDSRPRLSTGRSPVALAANSNPGWKTLGAPRLAGFARRGFLRNKLTHTLLLGAIIYSTLGASDPANRFTELGHQMMCICGCNQILLECNHVGCPASDGMRTELIASVQRGDSDSLVEQGFVQKYGPTVLAAPTNKGFDRTAYIVPFVALFLGFGLIVMVIRSWKNRPTPALADGLRPLRGAVLEQFRDQARKETDL